MAVDRILYMSDNQVASSWASGANYSTNHINLRAIPSYPPTAGYGPGEPVWLWVVVRAAVTTCTSINATLEDSTDDSSFAATAVASGAIAIATLLIGYVQLHVALPAGIRQYIRMNYVVVGSTTSVGAYDAYLTSF
jgi:hypothetical protein